MTETETAELLALIQAFDRRTVGEADIAAWHLVLKDTDVTDAADAVSGYFRDNTAWLMPAAIHNRAREIARQRAGRQRVTELEASIEAEAEAGPPGNLSMDGLNAALKAKPGEELSDRQQRVRRIYLGVHRVEGGTQGRYVREARMTAPKSHRSDTDRQRIRALAGLDGRTQG